MEDKVNKNFNSVLMSNYLHIRLNLFTTRLERFLKLLSICSSICTVCIALVLFLVNYFNNPIWAVNISLSLLIVDIISIIIFFIIKGFYNHIISIKDDSLRVLDEIIKEKRAKPSI